MQKSDHKVTFPDVTKVENPLEINLILYYSIFNFSSSFIFFASFLWMLLIDVV